MIRQRGASLKNNGLWRRSFDDARKQQRDRVGEPCPCRVPKGNSWGLYPRHPIGEIPHRLLFGRGGASRASTSSDAKHRPAETAWVKDSLLENPASSIMLAKYGWIVPRGPSPIDG